LPSGATPTGAPTAIDARPHCPSTRASNPQASRHLFPCTALTGCLHHELEPPCWSPTICFGDFPLPLFHGRERRRGRKEGARRRPRRAKGTGAPSMSRKPEPRMDRSGTTPQGGRRRAGTPTPCTTTPRRPPSPGRPRLHHRPNVSTVAAVFTFPPPWSLPGCSGGVETRRHVNIPECWPSSRRTAAPQQSGALGYSCP
jgi:hypothetical protein